MKKTVTIESIVGFCAFLALMCGGFYAICSLANWTPAFLLTIKNICSIVLTVIAVVCGWIWLFSTNMNKTLKIVLATFYVVFAILAVIGYIR